MLMRNERGIIRKAYMPCAVGETRNNTQRDCEAQNAKRYVEKSGHWKEGVMDTRTLNEYRYRSRSVELTYLWEKRRKVVGNKAHRRKGRENIKRATL